MLDMLDLPAAISANIPKDDARDSFETSFAEKLLRRPSENGYVPPMSSQLSATVAED